MMIAFLRSRVPIGVAVCLLVACRAGVATQASRAEPVYTEHPTTWFEDIAAAPSVSPDGMRALYGGPGDLGLLDLSTGAVVANKVQRPIRIGGVDFAGPAVFRGPRALAVRGSFKGQSGWFSERGSDLEQLSVPANARPYWSNDGESIAYRRSSDPPGLIAVGSLAQPLTVTLPGRVMGMAWAPDGQSVYALVLDDDGISALFRVSRANGQVFRVMGNLDAPTQSSPFAVTERHAYLALASDSVPAPAARHDPDADRDLDIYEIDLTTGRRRAIVNTPLDEFAPAVAAGHLFWTSSEVRQSVAIVPAAGGEARDLIEAALLPTWSPDSRRIGYTFGPWRLADWALNLDGGVAEVDLTTGTVRTRTRPITGYHEDFSPVWSPDGRWLAYHSHRSAAPVASYASKGSTDDMYLRRAAGATEEIRLTDFGWEVGMPDWAPDSRRLVFGTWTKAAPGVSQPWIATIDPDSGRASAITRLPLPPPMKGGEWTAWSPDGTHIAVEEKTTERTHTLWVVTVDGSSASKLLEYPMATYGGLDWMPAGDALVYAAGVDEPPQLYTIARAGGAARKLTNDRATLLHPQVSPDGKWIACTRLQVIKTIWRMRLEGV